MLNHKKFRGQISNRFARTEAQKNVKCSFWGYTIDKGVYAFYQFFTNFAKLISDEPNKIEGCATTRFEDLDLNCVIGWFRKI